MNFCGVCGSLKEKKDMHIHPYNKHNIQYYCNNCREQSLKETREYWINKGQPEYARHFND